MLSVPQYYDICRNKIQFKIIPVCQIAKSILTKETDMGWVKLIMPTGKGV